MVRRRCRSSGCASRRSAVAFHGVEGLALLSLCPLVEDQLLGGINLLAVADTGIGDHFQQGVALAGQPFCNRSRKPGDRALRVCRHIKAPQAELQCVERPALPRFAVFLADFDADLLGAHAVAPQEAAVGEVDGVAAGQFAKAVFILVGLHVQELGLIVGVVAGGGVPAPPSTRR
jgi:hypothetical protein